MPTYDSDLLFDNDFKRMSEAQRERFMRAVKFLVEDLKAGRLPRGGLRVKPWEGHPGHWELTWEYHDGRALFRYGDEIPGKPGPHIIWERIGGHEILD
ncbi:MAG TPA: hypothetical protein VMV29_16715 [Ktedonobacterales bacterium]|nr:hypothetical protein [Ktedonobacterales bacterium]